MNNDIKLTAEEKRAIYRLEKLAATFPKTLMLFSWSGNLKVLKIPPGRFPDGVISPFIVADIEGITNDGGDPD